MQGTESSWQDVLHALRTVSSTDEQSRLIDGMLARRQVATLVFVNAHVLNLASRDPVLAHTLRNSSHLLRDGSGLALLMKILGRKPGLNMNGTDLIPRVLERHGGRRIAIFGTREPWLCRAAEVVSQRYGVRPEHMIAADGFQSDEVYLRHFEAFRPGIVLLGMGSPKQDRIAHLLAQRATFPCLIICGGAVLDFLAGRFPRAPLWLRATGLEWMFRLACEPRRLFSRYVIGNPLFIARATRYAWQSWERRSASAWTHGPLTQIQPVAPDDAADRPVAEAGERPLPHRRGAIPEATTAAGSAATTAASSVSATTAAATMAAPASATATATTTAATASTVAARAERALEVTHHVD